MSLFGEILDKIIHPARAQGQPQTHAQSQPQSQPQPQPQSQPQSQSQSRSQPQPNSPAQQVGLAQPAGPTQQSQGSGSVDVESVLNALAKNKTEQLNWRSSIVDLLKLLDLDSSLEARRKLAQELHYTGSTSDSATMNVWLIHEVMQKLAENGGKVPDELKH